MNKRDLGFRLSPKLFKYRLNRWFGYKNISPITLTFSITAACQSRCKTCRIGDMYHDDPARAANDLTIDEIEKIFKSMNPVYFFNISGGEPFLRKDLPKIVELACKYLRPRVIHIPTNAIQTEKIAHDTKAILEIVKKYDPTVPFTIKPSIDGIEDKHDEIRGVKGNFEKLLDTIKELKAIEKEYDNFHLELGTVISNYNVNHLDEIEDFVHSLNIESYRNEVAEQRAEFFNIGDPITPDAATYRRLMQGFTKKIEDNIVKKRSQAKTTEALRVIYYALACKILETNTQVIPCYAGISNVHINYDGGVWPCCVLGYEHQMGNLRDFEYDFKKLWLSEHAQETIDYIKKKNCACPLANQAYSNILMNVPTLFKAGLKVIKYNG
ncbi:MAG: radical SAM protein [Oscillospiraceae bacterium]|nr:radical SAM protein [Oscillospiraceae bacterium]